ncbi:MAG: hemerythrin domain-containing protein [Solirubrobacterales bacterium]|nr:hemerythrin domain-containing protein [Solirubrobacterales bacterium]
MEMGTLGTALEREHHEIDAGIEGFGAEGADREERAGSLRRAILALRRHIFLEEEFLFPPMQQDLAIPTMVMLREHGEIWRSLDAIEAGLDSDSSDDALQGACRDLLAQLEKHNEKEEPIFYEVADDTLSPAQNSVLRDLLEDSEMPEGWVCSKAGEELPPVPGQRN